MKRELGRFASHSYRCAGLFALLIIAGCSTFDMGAIRRELETRMTGRVELGSEVALTSMPIKRLESTVDQAGTAHIVALDAKRQVHHIAVDRGGVSHDEIIGSLSSEADLDKAALDIVEYPVGTIRIGADTAEYVRPIAGGDWSRTGGNRCRKYLVVHASLYCAFVASGKEVGTAPRTDVNFALIVILPIVWTQTVQPGKLVLAERVDSSWVVRTVIDPATNWSADERAFAIGIDERETVHVVSQGWRGGELLAILPAGPSLAGGSGGPDTALHYARFRLPFGGVQSAARTDWQQVSSEVSGWLRGANCLPDQWDVARRVSIAPRAGAALSLLEMTHCYVRPSKDGKRGWPTENVNAWATATLNGSTFDFVATEDFPAGRKYFNLDRSAVLRVDADDVQHILVVSNPVGWTGELLMVYIRRNQDGRLAATVFREPCMPSAPRTLATGKSGAVFAAWVARGERLIGRWLTDAPVAIESRP